MSEEPSSLRPTVCAYLLTDTRGKERRRELGVGRGRGDCPQKTTQEATEGSLQMEQGERQPGEYILQIFLFGFL